jgi:protein-glutamine gamma-glutamyltransferase
MRLTRRQFDLTALTVLCASWLHAPHFPFWLNVAITLLIALRWLQRRLRPDWGKPPALLRLPLTLALPVAVWLQYGNIFGLDPGSVFAVGMLVLKLTETETARDARAVATFAMFVLMAALLFEQDLLTTIYVGVGVVPLLVALRALEYDDATTPTPTPALANFRTSASAALANLFAAVPLALLVFLFLPRLASPLWATQTVPQGKTGLDDSMSPGNLGELLLDDSPAFRVSFDAEVPPAAQRYWRGVVLWRYDGQRWSRAGGLPLEATRQPLRTHGTEVNYEITQEPSQRRWMFALDLPTSDANNAQRDEDYTLAASRPVGKLTVYRLSSAPAYSLLGLDSRQRERGLRLPANFNPRAVALGQQWAQEYGNDSAKIVQAGLNLIRRDFRYTLTPPPLGRQAMDDFLFETKAGYCEHFSSAFAVLMRAAGVPTRVVLGYQGGYWSDVGGYMVIRQSDAHAWNEVWLPDRGWIRVDPTAAVRPDRVELGAGSANADNSRWFGREWMLEMRNRWDLVNHLWTRVVVQFDELTQSGLLRSVGIEKADWRELGIAFAICMSLLAALGLWWAMHRDRRGGDALDHAYDRLCARLARLGMTRTASEGPSDYLQRVLQSLPRARERLEPLFARYVHLRYAQQTGDAAQVREFARAVRRADLRGLRVS